MFKNKKWLTLSALAAIVLAVGLVSFFAIEGSVSADELTPEDPEEVLPGEGLGFGPAGRGGRMPRYGGEVFLQSIADQSGIALEDLQTAVENRERLEVILSDAGFTAEEIDTMFYNAEIAVIDQGVVDGKITEDQAADMKQRLDDAIARRAAAEETRSAIGDLWQTTLSEKLGLSVEEMQSLFSETRDEVIQKALDQGLITEEQAQQWLENHEDGMPFFGGRGNHRMPGMGQPGFDNGGMRGMPFDDTDS